MKSGVASYSSSDSCVDEGNTKLRVGVQPAGSPGGGGDSAAHLHWPRTCAGGPANYGCAHTEGSGLVTDATQILVFRFILSLNPQLKGEQMIILADCLPLPATYSLHTLFSLSPFLSPYPPTSIPMSLMVTQRDASPTSHN